MNKVIKSLFYYVLICMIFSKYFLYAQEESVSDMAERTMPSIVRIVVYDITGTQLGQGSGFFIAHGKILTNAHVVVGAYSAEVFSENEYYNQIIVLKSDKESDLALIGADDRDEVFLQFEEKQEIRPGQRIITIGNPMGLEKTISDGLVSAVRGVPGQIQVIQISAPISPGSSGGPLLTQDGRVIGVTSATLSEGQNLNFAIGIETISKFLRKKDNPQQLQKAKSRILWRVMLKWVVNIIVGFILLALGGGWWIIVILILVFTLIGWVFKSLYDWVIKLVRNRRMGRTYNEAQERLQEYEQRIAEFEERQAEIDRWFATIDAIKKDPSLLVEAMKELGIDVNQMAQEQPERLQELKEITPESSSQIDLFGNINDYDTKNESLFSFYCWKCGIEVQVDSSHGLGSVECGGCGTILSVPKG